jgi:branched-chain amino acid transport system permease protein
VRGRPQLFTSYAADRAPLNTGAKRVWFATLVLALLVLPFQLGTELTALMATAFAAAIGAIGLGILTGWAG